MIDYRLLNRTDLARSADIDRSETIRVGYDVRDGALVRKEVLWDAANFRRAELILSTKDFLPIGLKLHLTNGKSQTTHVFKDYKLNQLNFFTGVRGIWAPHPFGYERPANRRCQRVLPLVSGMRP